jgi:hypothetical protein
LFQVESSGIRKKIENNCAAAREFSINEKQVREWMKAEDTIS